MLSSVCCVVGLRKKKKKKKFSPQAEGWACGLRAAAPLLHPAGVLASAAASQMGTPQEDESIFAILVAGDTPNNLHQDKLGEYVR